MELVNTPVIRIISFVVLIVTLIAVSGVLSTASALMHDDKADICCDIEKNDESGTSSPCEAPACNCILCINAIVNSVMLTVKLPLSPDLLYLSSLRNFHPHEYIASIEYPPEEP